MRQEESLTIVNIKMGDAVADVVIIPGSVLAQQFNMPGQALTLPEKILETLYTAVDRYTEGWTLDGAPPARHPRHITSLVLEGYEYRWSDIIKCPDHAEKNRLVSEAPVASPKRTGRHLRLIQGGKA